MAKKQAPQKKKSKTTKSYSGEGSAVYCLGMIGALVYYIATATGFWDGAWGVVKALLWPAFLVYEAMKFLGI